MQIVAQRVAGLAVGLGIVVGVLDALLLGQPDAVGRRTEPAQQGEDGERDDAEHGDLAQRVEAAEVDQDDVDDVACRRLRVGALEEEVARSLSGAGASSPHRRCAAMPAPARRRR